MNVTDRIKTLNIEKNAFIDGKYIESISKETLSKQASYDVSYISGIALCNEDDIDKAVEVASKAYKSGVWSELKPSARKDVVLKLADLMEVNREELALLDTYETGRAYKNYYEDSIPKAIEAVRFFAEAVDKEYGAYIPSRGNDIGIVTRVPLGVVGLITPWNDPMVVTCWKLAPALLMGNSVVLKPAEQSSLSAIKLAGLAKEAGIPDGVFNVVPGLGEVAGKALALHKDVRGISFTGSSEVGKLILQYSGMSNMKRVTLECGGKGPYIVSANCKDIERAAKVLADNMFYNQGQICSAPSRVIVDKTVQEKFVEALKKESERYVPGDPFEYDNNVGCVVSREQYNKVNRYISIAREEGCEVYQAKSVKRHDSNACCIQPTIILNAKNDSKVAREEIFGPVVTILGANNIDEALMLANNSEYGLAGAVWTDDLNEAYYAIDKLEVGLAHINSYGNDDNSAPFGGVKQSGLGKDKSAYAFADFSDIKTIWMHFEL